MQTMPDFSELIRIVQTPEGRKLLSLLQSTDSQTLSRAMSSAKSGDYNGAKEALSDILNTPEAQALLNQLGR